MERDIDRDTARLYLLAVEQLAEEGDKAAKVAWDFLMMRSLKFADRVGPDFTHADAVSWASNIHHSTWGENGLGSRLKARVVLLRIKGE